MVDSQQIAQLIAADLRAVFDRYEGKKNTPIVRKQMARDLHAFLSKYREAGLPISHVRGLVDTSTNRFHVRVDQSFLVKNGRVCGACGGEGKVYCNSWSHGVTLQECRTCLGTGLVASVAQVYDLNRFREMRAKTYP